MAATAAQEPRLLFAQPHEIVTFIDSLQREFPDAPRSRIAEAMFECRRISAAIASREALKENIRTKLSARKYSSGPQSRSAERLVVNPSSHRRSGEELQLTA